MFSREENHTLIRKVKRFVLHVFFPPALPDFGAIRYKKLHVMLLSLFTGGLEIGAAEAVIFMGVNQTTFARLSRKSVTLWQ